jgi:hypothetical protein
MCWFIEGRGFLDRRSNRQSSVDCREEKGDDCRKPCSGNGSLARPGMILVVGYE